jgi:hypothetical protein
MYGCGNTLVPASDAPVAYRRIQAAMTLLCPHETEQKLLPVASETARGWSRHQVAFEQSVAFQDSSFCL